MSSPAFSQSNFNRQLKKYYTFYTGGFIAFLLALALAEQMGMSRAWIGYWFLFATIGLYAGIGWMTRTTDVAEYYVAGRRVPSFFNGMATGADWMSAASFIGMAGTLFLSGFDGLAGILVCAMLGGMRAVTWTQVAQYIVLIIAYMTPVVWLGVKHTGIPVPQFAYGYTLQKLGDVEKKITADPKEQEVRKIFADRAAAGKAALAD